MRLNLWDILQASGAICSIGGLVWIFSGGSPWLGYLVAAGVFVVVVASALARRPSPLVVPRSAMIATGKRLILGAKSEVILFGGDMSWASDYKEEIREIVSSGKRVVVVFPNSSAQKVRENRDILASVGATFVPTEFDIGLRAMVIDPHDRDDALVYMVNRTLRQEAIAVAEGEPGSMQNYEYIAKVYTCQQDLIQVQAIIKVYEALERQ